MKSYKFTTPPDKWSLGEDVRDEAYKLARLIGDMDFQHFSDCFWLKFGGDGDNGETLAYLIDALIDQGYVEIIIKEKDSEKLSE